MCPFGNDLGLVRVLHDRNRIARQQGIDDRACDLAGLIEAFDGPHLAAGIHH